VRPQFRCSRVLFTRTSERSWASEIMAFVRILNQTYFVDARTGMVLEANTPRLVGMHSCCVCRAQNLLLGKKKEKKAFVRGRGIVFRHYYRSLARSARKDFRDGAVVPFE
jgi:hypothetical protein